MKTIKTVCYNQEREWTSREEAMEFFFNGVICSEGSEQERYMTILIKLQAGLDICSDN